MTEPTYEATSLTNTPLSVKDKLLIHVILHGQAESFPLKKKKRMKPMSLQVRKDLYFVSYAKSVTWARKLWIARKLAHLDGHRLDMWSARHKLVRGKSHPQFFVAVCKRCRGVFIVEHARRETHWLFPYDKCRAVPRKVVQVGGKVMVAGNPLMTASYKRKFI